jgi:hypothetical protein
MGATTALRPALERAIDVLGPVTSLWRAPLPALQALAEEVGVKAAGFDKFDLVRRLADLSSGPARDAVRGLSREYALAGRTSVSIRLPSSDVHLAAADKMVEDCVRGLAGGADPFGQPLRPAVSESPALNWAVSGDGELIMEFVKYGAAHVALEGYEWRKSRSTQRVHVLRSGDGCLHLRGDYYAAKSVAEQLELAGFTGTEPMQFVVNDAEALADALGGRLTRNKGRATEDRPIDTKDLQSRAGGDIRTDDDYDAEVEGYEPHVEAVTFDCEGCAGHVTVEASLTRPTLFFRTEAREQDIQRVLAAVVDMKTGAGSP